VRTAFADLLPSQIRNRQVKGSGTPFAQNLIRNNLDFFREHLSQGVLAREGIIDRQKVIRCFASEEPFLVANAPTILSCMAAEVWLQKWTDFQQRAAPLSMAF
jgi:asparagine synthase (glutamine-hydrolysing)